MTQDLVIKSEKRNYGELFRFDLNWGAPDHGPVALRLDDGTVLTATNVSSYKGLRVWEVPVFPGSAVEAQLDQLIAKTTTNRLVIFHQDDKQAWRWPSRTNKGAGVVSRPTRHVHRTGSNDPKFAAKLEAIQLPDDVLLDVNAVLAKVRTAFDVESKNETKRASKLMARMYAAVEKAYPAGYDPKKRDHEISASLARVLFLLFGDDTEMWASDLFQDFIKDHTARDGSDVGERLNELFEVLDIPPTSRGGLAADLVAFPYVNGGIFEESIALPSLDHEFRTALLDAAAVDWAAISPAIFGSMFQSVRDTQTRRELGEHYTSEENILKTLNPLFLDELRAELAHVQTLQRRGDRERRLHALWSRLGEIRYMDPACGCGNFIIVAYRELRELELQIMEALADLQHGEDSKALDADWTSLLRVTLDHFYGIEIDEWPARIAETAMFLIDRQCDLRMRERFGVAPERLPIQRSARIEVGNALRVDWSKICPPSHDVIIAGNPPFIGARLKTDDQAADLRAAWGRQYNADMDLVTGWHARAMQYYGSLAGRWALVTTNSICQGAAPAGLFGPIASQGWKIKFAHRTFAWTSEASGAAAVHCVIIGFAREVARPRLFDYPTLNGEPREVSVSTINAYLVDAPWVLVDKRRSVLSPALTKCDFGSMANDGGNLLVDPDDYGAIAADPIARKFLRPFKGSDELVKNKQRWCLWLEGASAADIQASPILQRRIEGVREHRAPSRREATRRLAEVPHLFGERRQPKTPYICIPRHVTETRRYFTVDRFEPSIVCGDANFAAEDPTGLLFAVLSSTMFMTWQRTVGGRIKSDLRFSSTIVWNNFPVPALAPQAHRNIVDAGEKLRLVRTELAGLSLAEMYTPKKLDPALQEAHNALDAAVDPAFGLTSDQELTELQRQHTLFERYADMALGLLAPTPARRRNATS
jgi:hypothetical protein